ncbi:hypothetical protein [Fodinibius sp.]|uniref:hypothetical protein n=1 Tax=Fodinibius sp. TaxID=1872440 RepID=UPI003A0FEBDE
MLENYPQLAREDLKAIFGFAQACLADEKCVSAWQACVNFLRTKTSRADSVRAFTSRRP